MEDFMIPQEKSAGVASGLQEAFGVTEFEDIRMITRGHTSSLVFRIVVGGTPYLLKIIMRKDSPARHYACMRAAAEAGLAPHVWYTNVEEKICITDFMEEAPFPVTEARVRIPAALRALHGLPPFPRTPNHMNTTCMFLMHKGAAVDDFVQKLQAANLLPKGKSAELFASYAQVAAVYPTHDENHHDPDMVSSHNDLFKPDNMLFSENRLWLVDWEAAFLNDRYADLAVAASLVVTNEAEERAFLQEYFGGPPDEYQLARFFVMQQIAHMFYGMVFLFLGSSGQPIDWSQTVPEFMDFHRRIWAGDVNLADNDTKIVYGKVHLEKLLGNVQKARYDEALRIVSTRHATA
jgi:hypothetical protein